MNWLEFAPVLQIFLAEALAKPTVLSITLEVCLSTWNQMQTCAEHMWLASVTAAVGSTQETLGVRLAVNDRGGSQQTGSFHQSHFDKKNMKIFSLQYLISVGKKESYYIHVLFNFSIH